MGDADPGDVDEARALERAIASSAPPRSGGGVPRLACAVTVHAARDHNLVVDMRDTGELHDLLCRLVREDEPSGVMPADFVGFQDCPDF